MSLVQVSKVAGVSKSTVSRVLNHDPRVSPETVRAVTHAVQQLGYTRPERMGRPRRSPNGLNKGSVALLFPDTDPAAIKTVLSGRLLHGIEEVLRRRGISMLVAGMPERDRLPQAVEQRLVDGVLVRGTVGEMSRKTFTEGMGRLPVVLVFEPKGPVPSHWDIVLEDNHAIGVLAYQYLAERGRKNLGFINVAPEHASFRHRLRAFSDAANEGGAKVYSVQTAGAPAEELVRQVLEQAKADGRTIDGLFVPGADSLVVDTYRALQSMGIETGKDLDLISCNNDPTRLATLDPRLANLDIQPEAIGRAAAEMLLWRLQFPRDPQRRLSVAPQIVLPTVG